MSRSISRYEIYPVRSSRSEEFRRARRIPGREIEERPEPPVTTSEKGSTWTGDVPGRCDVCGEFATDSAGSRSRTPLQRAGRPHSETLCLGEAQHRRNTARPSSHVLGETPSPYRRWRRASGAGRTSTDPVRAAGAAGLSLSPAASCRTQRPGERVTDRQSSEAEQFRRPKREDARYLVETGRRPRPAAMNCISRYRNRLADPEYYVNTDTTLAGVSSWVTHHKKAVRDAVAERGRT